MEAEEPPDGDRGSEKEVSHRGAPLVKPLPRSVIHTMSDSDTEVEAEWQEVKGRRKRREGRRRRHIDRENNLLPGQGEEGGSTFVAQEQDTAAFPPPTAPPTPPVPSPSHMEEVEQDQQDWDQQVQELHARDLQEQDQQEQDQLPTRVLPTWQQRQLDVALARARERAASSPPAPTLATRPLGAAARVGAGGEEASLSRALARATSN